MDADGAARGAWMQMEQQGRKRGRLLGLWEDSDGLWEDSAGGHFQR